MSDNNENMTIEGKNPVYEAIAAKTPIDKILIKKGEKQALARIAGAARAAGLVVAEVPAGKLDALSQTGRHQGVIALCPPYAYSDIDDIFLAAEEKNEPPFIIILDGISDPHNLGAIIRSAECAGAHGVIIPKHRACGVTAAAAKAAAGACAHMKVAKAVNITEILKELKGRGVWVTCADTSGASIYGAESKPALTGAIALVIGGEGGGVSRLVKETCDFTVSIPMMGKIESLNASCAAAVIMYEALRGRLAEA